MTLSYNSNKTALDMIKKYPKRALLVNEYFANEISKTVPDGEDGMKIVNSLLEVLENGYQNVFENIQIKDIQAKPSLFSQEILLALYHNSVTERVDFDAAMKQIIRYNKISNILSVQESEQLFLDYFKVSKEQIDQLEYYIISGIHDIIIFRLRDRGIGIEDNLIVDIIRTIENPENQDGIEIEIIQLEVEIITSDINLSNFFYGSNTSEETFNPIGDKILLFQQALNQTMNRKYIEADIFYKWLFEEIENYI